MREYHNNSTSEDISLLTVVVASVVSVGVAVVAAVVVLLSVVMHVDKGKVIDIFVIGSICIPPVAVVESKTYPEYG